MSEKAGNLVLDNWAMPDRVLFGEVAISSLAKIYYGVDLDRHRVQDASGSLVLLELNDVPMSDSVLHRQSWVEVLRLFNLYQFLPHCYTTTTTAIQEGYELPIAISATDSSLQGDVSSKSVWTDIADLVDEALIDVLMEMQTENWPVPEVGYDFADNHGKVIAMAELAWIDAKVAVALTPDDREIFQGQSWYVVEIDEILTSLNDIRGRLIGGYH